MSEGGREQTREREGVSKHESDQATQQHKLAGKRMNAGTSEEGMGGREIEEV